MAVFISGKRSPEQYNINQFFYLIYIQEFSINRIETKPWNFITYPIPMHA